MVYVVTTLTLIVLFYFELEIFSIFLIDEVSESIVHSIIY